MKRSAKQFLCTQPAWWKQTNLFGATGFWGKFGRNVTLSCNPSIYCIIINRSMFQIVLLCSYVYRCYNVFQKWVVLDLHYLVWNKGCCCLFWDGIGCFFSKCQRNMMFVSLSYQECATYFEIKGKLFNSRWLSWKPGYTWNWERRADSGSPENQLFSAQHSHVWTNRAVRQYHPFV